MGGGGVQRADAMEACRYIINELKASVPIWKKEVYNDGEVWKENREFYNFYRIRRIFGCISVS